MFPQSDREAEEDLPTILFQRGYANELIQLGDRGQLPSWDSYQAIALTI